MVRKVVAGKKSNVDTTAQSTRRRALKVIGGAGAGSMVFPGLAVAQDDAESKSGSNPEISSDWWSGGDFDPRSDAELVAEGSSTYLSENDEAPDWFTIGENNDLKYKPHGIYKKPSSERDDDFRSTDQATIAQDAGGTELCLPTSIKIRGMTVGLEACHYGGCEWSLKRVSSVVSVPGPKTTVESDTTSREISPAPLILMSGHIPSRSSSLVRRLFRVWTWKEKYADGRSPETSAGIWTLDSISMTRT